MKYIILLLISFNTFANEMLVKQGPISVNLSDIDGYTVKIPAETRAGFFDSPDRLNKTIDTMIKMKHVVNYGLENGFITKDEVKDDVKFRIQEYIVNIDESLSIFERQLLIEKLESFLYLEELYRKMKHHVQKNIKVEDALELANEHYVSNKNLYHQSQAYDLDYINVMYSEENKDEKLTLSKSIQKELTTMSFKDLRARYEDQERKQHIIFAADLKKYKYNDKYKTFSDFIYKQDKEGVVEEILDANDRFIIIKINKYYKDKYLEFDEVKGTIVKQLLNEKFDKEFGNLMMKLTTDEIEINSNNINLLRTRYKNS